MNKNLKLVFLPPLVVCIQFGIGCESSGNSSGIISDVDSDTDSDSDGDGDGDSDTDTDTDTDTDMDSDTDSDTDSDADSDSDTDTYWEDADGDGWIAGIDCDDNNPDANQGEPEIWDPPNGVDEDCDGLTDEVPAFDDDYDDDGLSNDMENDIGTDPNNEDTDGDGVTDLVEWVAGTDPNDPNSNPGAEGNFYFLIPYVEAPDPFEDTLNFTTNIQKADLFFLVDNTGSMGEEINNLTNSLSSYIIPEVNDVIPDVWFGVGRFADYPLEPYGLGPENDMYDELGYVDDVFRLVQRMTPSTAEAQTAVESLELSWGIDGPESHVPALFATATGDGFGSYLDSQNDCDSSEIGYPCFREGAVPMIMLITDAPFHNDPDGYSPYIGISPIPPEYADAADELDNIHAKVISIISSTDAQSNCESIAVDTGTVDDSDNPLVFSVAADGTGLDETVVQAVQILVSSVPMDISTEGKDDITDSVDATIFIDYITPYNVTTPNCTGSLVTDDLDGDDIDDIFLDVNPGWPVCFDVIPKTNTTVEQTPEPQLFKAYINVIGNTITVLDTRTVFFLVPPSAPIDPT